MRGLKIDNLKRPYTTAQLQEKLSSYGEIDIFWQNQVKSTCFMTYKDPQAADDCQKDMNEQIWPQNGNVLEVTPMKANNVQQRIDMEKDQQSQKRVQIKPQAAEDEQDKYQNYNNNFVVSYDEKRQKKIINIKDLKLMRQNSKSDGGPRELKKTQSNISINNSSGVQNQERNPSNERNYREYREGRDNLGQKENDINLGDRHKKYREDSRDRQKSQDRESRSKLYSSREDRYCDQRRDDRNHQHHREREGRQRDSKGDRYENNNRSRNYDSRTQKPVLTVDQIFKKTVTYPPIYYTPVSDEIIKERLENNFTENIKKQINEEKEIQQGEQRFGRTHPNRRFQNDNNFRYEQYSKRPYPRSNYSRERSRNYERRRRSESKSNRKYGRQGREDSAKPYKKQSGINNDENNGFKYSNSQAEQKNRKTHKRNSQESYQSFKQIELDQGLINKTPSIAPYDQDNLIIQPSSLVESKKNKNIQKETTIDQIPSASLIPNSERLVNIQSVSDIKDEKLSSSQQEFTVHGERGQHIESKYREEEKNEGQRKEKRSRSRSRSNKKKQSKRSPRNRKYSSPDKYRKNSRSKERSNKHRR